jgi:hypothetical protein
MKEETRRNTRKIRKIKRKEGQPFFLKIKIENAGHPTRNQTASIHKYSMTHRYNTRFQLKKVHVVPLQAQPLQAQPRQSVATQTDAVQCELELMRQQSDSSTIVNYFLARAAASKSFSDKVLETIKLFEHLYEHPVLLTTHLRMKDTVWNKMAQLDSEMTNVLMRLPSTLEIDRYDLATRTTIARLHNLMNMIRQKYY